MKTLFLLSTLAIYAGAVQGQSIKIDKQYLLSVTSQDGAPCRACMVRYDAAARTALGYGQTDSLGLVKLPVELLPRLRSISVEFGKEWYGGPFLQAAEPSQTIALTLVDEQPKHLLQNTLKEVVVTGHQQLIDDTGEAVVYNVAADIANPGTDATDVLRRTPLVAVDINGTPSIKGSTSIKILLNGRTVSYLQPSDLLTQIPSDLITKVEVITAPGAKYDADGAAGIINIITKSPVALNHTGSVNTGLGTKGSHLFISDTYNTKNVSISTGIGLLSFYNHTQASQQARYTNENLPFFDRTSIGYSRGLSSSYQGSIATLNKKNYVELSVIAFLQNVKPEESFLSRNSRSSALEYDGLFASTNKTATVSTNLFFERKFTKNNQKISAVVEAGYLPTNNLVALSNNGFGLSISNSIRNTNTLYTSSAKADYEFNLHKKHFFEVGTKVSSSSSTGINTTVVDSSSTNSSTTSDTERVIYHLTYSIASSYLSYKLVATPRLSFKSGLRYEHTTSAYTGHKYGDTTGDYQQSNLFPSLTAIYKVSNTSTLTGNYSYRIQRPDLGLLLPVSSYVSSSVRYIGNPRLNPEFSHVFELNASKYIKTNYFRASLYTTLTQGAISSVLSQYNGTTTTYTNAGSEKIVGLNVWVTTYPISAWSINYGFDFNYRKIANATLSNTGFRLTNTLNTTFKINDKWSAQLWGTFNTPKILLQGTENSFTFSNLSIKRELINKKLFVALSVDNPFTQGFTQKQQIVTHDYSSNSEVLYYNRGFRLLLNYKFGNSKNSSQRAKEPTINSGFQAITPE